MKKTVTLISLLCMAGAVTASAQQVTFRANIDAVILNGEALNRVSAAESNLGGIGFFVPAAQFNAFVNNPVWSLSEEGLTEEKLSEIITFLGSQSGFAAAGNIARLAVDSPAPASFGVLNGTINAGAAGFNPVFIIHDSPTGPAGLRAGSNIGIVASTFSTLASGTAPVAFTGTAQVWDTFLVGTPGSVQLATVIPEPSTYAALFGIFALAGVMIRRRLRK